MWLEPEKFSARGRLKRDAEHDADKANARKDRKDRKKITDRV